MAFTTRSLHWTQKVALIRHNLHAASRSGDFTFFRHLQAQGLIDGTNHVAILSAALGDDTDNLLASLDDLTTGIAQVHEDAFKNVYDAVKASLSREGNERSSAIFVDITLHRQTADMAIDKMTNSAIFLIQQQPSTAQEAAANVWIDGTIIMADCVEICLMNMDKLENIGDDFIRLEASWSSVQNSMSCAITAWRGIYNLMDSSVASSEHDSSRGGSLAAATGIVFRRLSNAFATTSPTQSRSGSIAHSNRSRSNSVAPDVRPSSQIRGQIFNALPEKLPDRNPFHHTNLSPIPPTPAMLDEINPFDTSASPPVPDVPALHRMNAMVI